MSSFFKTLNKIDERTKHSVYGWMREAERELNLCNIPMLVKSICILYFRDDEMFEVIGDGTMTDKTNKRITKINQHDWENASYGYVKIPSMNQCIYQWDMKINYVSNNYDLTIGISSKSRSNEDIATERDGSHTYAYIGDGEKVSSSFVSTNWTKYGTKLKDNDKLTMHLNLKNGQLTYFINDLNQGIAFNNISQGKDITYRLAITLYGTGASVQILNFKTVL